MKCAKKFIQIKCFSLFEINHCVVFSWKHNNISWIYRIEEICNQKYSIKTRKRPNAHRQRMKDKKKLCTIWENAFGRKCTPPLLLSSAAPLCYHQKYSHTVFAPSPTFSTLTHKPHNSKTNTNTKTHFKNSLSNIIDTHCTNSQHSHTHTSSTVFCASRLFELNATYFRYIGRWNKMQSKKNRKNKIESTKCSTLTIYKFSECLKMCERTKKI